MKNGFNKMDGGFDKILGRLDRMENELDNIDSINNVQDQMSEKIAIINNKLEKIISVKLSDL